LDHHNENLSLLEVRNLRTYFYTESGIVKAVDGVDFFLQRGSTLALVGESGCGKTVTARSIIRTIQKPGEIIGGEVLLEGDDLLKYSEERMRREVRGKKIAMIFQEPMTSLNPVFTIIDQITEGILLHRTRNRKQAIKMGVEMMKKVKIPSPEIRAFDYPHLFSGGMRQRVMIAMALSCNPFLLIADEPTTALDVTVQMQMIELIKGLKKKFAISVLLITHDLGVVAEMADFVAMMYAGKLVERADVESIFKSPKHPYTKSLFKCLPSMVERDETLETIPGVVPDLIELPAGCYFSERCLKAHETCFKKEPEFIETGEGHFVRCHLFSGE